MKRCGGWMMWILLASACSVSPGDPILDSMTHWLQTCEIDGDCLSGYSCLCGVCTAPCGGDGMCSNLPAPALCADTAALAVDMPRCDVERSGGVCLPMCPARGCPVGTTCDAGVCAPIPGVCAPGAVRSVSCGACGDGQAGMGRQRCEGGAWLECECDPAGDMGTCTQGQTRQDVCSCPQGGQGMYSLVCDQGSFTPSGGCQCEEEDMSAMCEAPMCQPDQVGRLVADATECGMALCAPIGVHACGDQMCDNQTQYCVEETAGPPPEDMGSGVVYRCEAIPLECTQTEPSCACLTLNAGGEPGVCRVEPSGLFWLEVDLQ